ncbi:sigma-70 family RNA polymerase sigma factor [bacterium]|nr:sigma-70 family RNA polymerase sigma factor [bacterium]
MHRVINSLHETADERLVEMAAGGEVVAFDALVKRFQRAVYAVAFAVLADRDAALDVIQESFITAYRRLHDLNDPSRFGPWVCGIARNKAKQLIRDYTRRNNHEVPLPEAELAADTTPVHEGTDRIREAMSTLTEVQADIVSLFYMEGYSIKECARLLQVPEGTVKRRLHDARARLKKEMTGMVMQHLKEFALPEDYHVVLEKSTPIHTTRPQLVYFKDHWVLIWQDGVQWEPYDGPFWFWLSESTDGENWSEPHKLELPKGSDEMRYNPDYLQLMSACVAGDKLFFVTQQFAGHADLYSSEDTINWSLHPRLRMGMIGRPSLFSSGSDLYMVYPSAVPYCGYRVDMIRSSDCGFSWRWLNSPYRGDGQIHDVAGLASGGRIYVAWREVLGKWVPTGEVSGAVHWQEHITAVQDSEVPEGALTQRVWTGQSSDGGQTWNHRVWKPQEYPDNSGLTIYPLPEKPEPLLVKALDIAKPYYSNSLQFASFGKVMALAQEVRRDDAAVEVWVTFSRDSGKTWLQKAVYSKGALGEPAIAFDPTGTLMLAGSSRTNKEAHPWVVQSRIGNEAGKPVT